MARHVRRICALAVVALATVAITTSVSIPDPHAVSDGSAEHAALSHRPTLTSRATARVERLGVTTTAAESSRPEELFVPVLDRHTSAATLGPTALLRGRAPPV